MVWEPFAGLAAALVVSLQHGRQGFGAEINPEFFRLACERLNFEAQGDLLDAIHYPKQAG